MATLSSVVPVAAAFAPRTRRAGARSTATVAMASKSSKGAAKARSQLQLRAVGGFDFWAWLNEAMAKDVGGYAGNEETLKGPKGSAPQGASKPAAKAPAKSGGFSLPKFGK